MTSCHAIAYQVPPTQTLSREAEDFHRGGKYPKDVPLPTFLAYLRLVQLMILDWYLYVPKS